MLAAGQETTPAPGYGAWEKWYFKTERNEAAFNEWRRLYDEMTGLMNDLLTLRVQYFDVFMMAHAGEAVSVSHGWLRGTNTASSAPTSVLLPTQGFQVEALKR